MDPLTFIIYVVVSIALDIIASMLAPKPKQDTPDTARDMENPTADAGRPVPVVFGTVTLKSPNILWFGDKTMDTYKVKA